MTFDPRLTGRSSPLVLSPEQDQPRVDPYGLRPRGLGTGRGELLRLALGPSAPYEPPMWARTITLPSQPVQVQSPDRSATSSRPGFPVRLQLPSPFSPGQPQAQDPLETLMGIPGGEAFGVGLGVVPGEQRGGFHNGVATAPITAANFATYGREGLMALASSIFLDGAYQQPEGALFGQDTTYQGPEDPGLIGAGVKGVIEANKAIGDAMWGVLDGVMGWVRQSDADFRVKQLASVFSTGHSSRPILPFEQGFISNVTTSIFGGAERYTLQELQNAAMTRGVDLVSMAAELWDVPYEVAAEVARNPNMSEEQMRQLSAGLPLSQNAATNLVVEGGYNIGLTVLGYAGAVKAAGAAAGALGGAARGGGAAGQFLNAVRPTAGFVGPSGIAGQVGRGAGFLTRKALQLNALNTTGGWTVRGFEWGIKQVAGMTGNEGVVRTMDRLLWEMPWSMNPGLNLIDGFTTHPLDTLRRLRQPGNRRIVIGAEGRLSEAGTINLSRPGVTLGARAITPGRLDFETGIGARIGAAAEREAARPTTPTGELDVAAISARRTAEAPVEVEIAGKMTELAPEHPVARAVEVVRGLSLDDMHQRIFRGLGFERDWLVSHFGPDNKFGLTLDDLRNFVVYGYGQVIRDRGFTPQNLPGATVAEKSNAFFRSEAPEILDSLFSDLSGETSWLAKSMKSQWWELSSLNDSNMAPIKGRLAAMYEPHIAFLNMAGWIRVSKMAEKAYREIGVATVPTYSRRVVRPFIRSFREMLMRKYQDGQKVTNHDVLLLRTNGGPVELLVPRLRQGRRQWTRAQLLKALDVIEQADDEARGAAARRVNDPFLPDDWTPGADFATDARLLGIQSQDVLAIETAMRDGPPRTPPSRSLLAKLEGDPELLAREPARAWEQAIAWYTEQLDRMTIVSQARRSLLDFGATVRATTAMADPDDMALAAQAARVEDAVESIVAQLVNRPRRLERGVRQPEAGVKYADPDGLMRWDRAAARAETVADEARRHLEDPTRQAVLVGEHAALSTQQQLVDSLARMAVYVRDNPGRVVIANAADQTLILDPAVHPLLKADALARADWSAVPRGTLPEAQSIAANGDELARALVGQVLGEVDEATPLATQLEAVTGRVRSYQAETVRIGEELLATDRMFSNIYGRLAQDTLAIHDRMLRGKVERTRRIVSRPPEVPRSAALRLRDVRTRLATARQALADVETRAGELGGRTGDLEWTVARNPLDGTELTYRTKAAAQAKMADLQALLGEEGMALSVQRVGRRYAIMEGQPRVVAEGISAAREAAPAPRVVSGEVIEGTSTREVSAAEDAGAAAFERAQQQARDETFLSEVAAGDARAQLSEVARELLDIEGTFADDLIGDAALDMERLVSRVGQQAVDDAQVELDAWRAQQQPLTGAEGAIEQAYRAGDVEEGQRLNREAEAQNGAAGAGGLTERAAVELERLPMAHPKFRGLESSQQTFNEALARELTPDESEVLQGLWWLISTGRNTADVDAALSRMDADQLVALAQRIRSEMPEGQGVTHGGVNEWVGANVGLFDGFDERVPGAAAVTDEAMDDSMRAALERLNEGAVTPSPRFTPGARTAFPDPLKETARIEATFQLREADDLITSDQPAFPSELQPRGREVRAASEVQVSEMAGRFDPELALRVESGGDGPPLVGADGVVLAGNGRTMAMRRMTEERWTQYRTALAERAEEFGLTREQVLAMDRPVLVREVGPEVMTPQYALALNARTGGMSAAEKAVAVSRLITPDDVAALGELGETVDLRTALRQKSRLPFIQRVMGELTEADQRGILTAEGEISKEAIDLVQQALLAKVLPDQGLVTRLIEAPEEAARYRTGLEMALGQVLLAESRAAIMGQPTTIGDTLALAMRRILDLTDQGIPSRDWPSYFNTQGMGLIEGADAGSELAAQLVTLRSQKEVATYLRGYARALDESLTAAGGLLIEEDRSLAGFLNRAAEAVEVERGRKTAAGEWTQGAPMFGQLDDIPLMAGDNGTTTHTFRTGGNEPAIVTERPIFGTPEQAVSAEIGDAAGVIVERLDDIDAVPAGAQVIFRHPHEGTRRAMQATLTDEQMEAAVREHYYAMSQGAAGSYWLETLADVNAGRGSLADLWLIQTGRNSDRYNVAGSIDAEFSGIMPTVDDGVADALRMLARARRIAQVTDQATSGDTVVRGGPARAVDPDFAARTGFEPDGQPHVDRMVADRDAGRRVIVPPGDEVAQRAAQQATGLPRRAHDGITVVNEYDPTRRAQALEARRGQLRSEVRDLEAAEIEAQAAARLPEGQPTELGFPEELLPLYQRYMADEAAVERGQLGGIGATGPTNVGDLFDALRSLDYGIDPRVAMPEEELATLREGLRRFLTDKLDEWGVESRPGDEGLSPTVPGAGTTPTQHYEMLEAMARELQERVYITDDPLEGYLGVAYEFVPPPSKVPGTRLFYSSDLTDELARFEARVPGLGEELAQGRQADWPTRVQAANDHYAAESIASAAFPRRLRSAIDIAFGPRAQRDIEGEAFSRFVADVLDVEPRTMARILNDPQLFEQYQETIGTLRGLVRYWHEHMATQRFGPTPFRPFRRVGLVNPQKLEEWTREYLNGRGQHGATLLATLESKRLAGAKYPTWEAWRKADNRVRAWFAERPGGVADWVERVYEGPVKRGSEAMSGVTVLYHAYRFLMDVRWLAMEFIEMPVLVVSREGPGALMDAAKFQRGGAPRLLFTEGNPLAAHMQDWAWWASQSDIGNYMRWRENGLMAVAKRTGERGMAAELERMARADPRLAELVRANGDSPMTYLRRLDRDWRLMSTRSRKLDEGELRAILEDYLTDGTITPQEIETMVANGKWVGHPDLEAAIAHADDPVTRALLRRLNVISEQAWQDASQLIFGQADRSNVQRMLNHPLLYWPISYQVKATRWLAGFLLDRSFGADTGALPAVMLGQIWEAHKDLVANDPEAQRWFQNNETLLFVAQMLLPITPMDIGVGLSPFTRLAHSMATGQDIGGGEPYRRNIMSVGTGYSVMELWPRLFAEQSAGGGMLPPEIAERLGYAFPRTIQVRPSASQVAQASQRQFEQLGGLPTDVRPEEPQRYASP